MLALPGFHLCVLWCLRRNTMLLHTFESPIILGMSKNMCKAQEMSRAVATRIQIRTGALRQQLTQRKTQSSEEDVFRELIENLRSVGRKRALHVRRIPPHKDRKEG
jgi:hypothetical protein